MNEIEFLEFEIVLYENSLKAEGALLLKLMTVSYISC